MEALISRRGGNGGYQANLEGQPVTSCWVSSSCQRLTVPAALFEHGSCLIVAEQKIEYSNDYNYSGGRAILYFDSAQMKTTILSNVKYVPKTDKSGYTEREGGYVTVNDDGYTFSAAGNTRSGCLASIPVK